MDPLDASLTRSSLPVRAIIALIPSGSPDSHSHDKHSHRVIDLCSGPAVFQTLVREGLLLKARPARLPCLVLSAVITLPDISYYDCYYFIQGFQQCHEADTLLSATGQVRKPRKKGVRSLAHSWEDIEKSELKPERPLPHGFPDSLCPTVPRQNILD